MAERLGYKQIKCYILTNTSPEKQVFRIADELRELIVVHTLPTPMECLSQEQHKAQEELRQFILSHSVRILFSTQNGLLRPLDLPKSVKQYFWLHNEPFYEVQEIKEGLMKQPSLYNRLKLYASPLLKKKWMRQTLQDYRERISAWDGFVVLCEAYKQMLTDTFELDQAEQDKIISITNTIDLDKQDSTHKEKVIVWVGRLELEKRVDRMLTIWQEVQQVLPDWRLKIYGNGSHLERCRRVIEQRALTRIELCGYESDKATIYSQASVMCMTSEREGWPIALMEAQRFACVPILFESFKAAAVIVGQEQRAGILVPPFNLRAFQEQLVALCHDSARLHKLAEQCLIKSQEYSPSINNPIWDKILSIDEDTTASPFP